MTSAAFSPSADREEDYIELGMNGAWQWNPLSAGWLDSYSLAYTVSSLLNQLFGKGKEPFWQQAYTNLVRWIIELYRVFPGGNGSPCRMFTAAPSAPTFSPPRSNRLRRWPRRFARGR